MISVVLALASIFTFSAEMPRVETVKKDLTWVIENVPELRPAHKIHVLAANSRVDYIVAIRFVPSTDRMYMMISPSYFNRSRRDRRSIMVHEMAHVAFFTGGFWGEGCKWHMQELMAYATEYAMYKKTKVSFERRRIITRYMRHHKKAVQRTCQ